MKKNIVLLSDGTGNSAAKRHKTNVWRLYEALDLSDPEKQVAFYDDGVGSQEFLPIKLLGSALGWGLARNVKELYTALCRTYEDGDRIYLFGFSRGAFTVRMLAGLIDHCGVVRADDEGELRRKVNRHFDTYRSRYKKGCLYRLLRWVCRRSQPSSAEPEDGTKVCIEFIGVWDTVDAYGFPVHGLVYLWNLLVWPLRFVDRRPAGNVRRACHALSIDDERSSFSPVLWEETSAKKDNDEPEGDHAGRKGDNGDKDETPSRIEQIWFAGVHADVGGGYPRNALALVPLNWMISKVEGTEERQDGLCFISTIRDEYKQRANWHGVEHDSRSGLRAYYRYEPRDIGQLCRDEGIDTPRIHFSALERIQKKVVAYAPTALPVDYEVVDGTGEKANQYRSYDEGKMKAARAYIGRRRWLYAGFVVATLTLMFLPVFHSGSSEDGCTGWWCVAGMPLELAACILPECVMPWMEAWIDVVQKPWRAPAILGVAFGLVFLKCRWHQATREHAAAAWAGLKRGD